MISGEFKRSLPPFANILRSYRLLDKIAKDIMVCENKTIKRWDGSIGEYKNYLRKKMVTMGQV
jgi:ATP-binding cassette subfamily F protein 2